MVRNLSGAIRVNRLRGACARVDNQRAGRSTYRGAPLASTMLCRLACPRRRLPVAAGNAATLPAYAVSSKLQRVKAGLNVPCSVAPIATSRRARVIRGLVSLHRDIRPRTTTGLPSLIRLAASSPTSTCGGLSRADNVSTRDHPRAADRAPAGRSSPSCGGGGTAASSSSSVTKSSAVKG